MTSTKSDIINRLKNEMLSLQGLSTIGNDPQPEMGLGQIKNAFPGNIFPLAAVHEFIAAGMEDVAATTGFLATLLAPLMKKGDACIWIGSSRMIFPPALKNFGICPDKIIFIELQKEKEILWAMEESLNAKDLLR